MTNKNLNLVELKNCYLENNQVLIKGFAEPDFAESIYQAINEIEPDKWDHYFFPESSMSRVMKKIPLIDDNKIFLQLSMALARLEYEKGNFSYSFKKPSAYRDAKAQGLYARCKAFLESECFKSTVAKIAGLNHLKLENWFISKYEEGDFLSKHNDTENGKIGFVFYLSKKWEPSYGGSLEFYLRKTGEHLFSYEPDFNQLLLFAIENDPPLLHEVLPVKADVERIAISGWLS
ncbi:MAG: hypothetical protein Roseis2KO_07590 [Roseivirga sp.]